MNERIRQILNEAGLAIQHDGIVLTKPITGHEAMEKFAELMVKECIDIYDEWAEYSTDINSFRMSRHHVKTRLGIM